MKKREVIIAKVMKRLGQDRMAPLDKKERGRFKDLKNPYSPAETEEEAKERREQRMKPHDITSFARDLKKVYKKYQNNYENLEFPKAVLRYVGDFMDRFHPQREDKIKLLNEAKKNRLFDFSLNKNLERAWRAVLKKWDLRNYRLESGL